VSNFGRLVFLFENIFEWIVYSSLVYNYFYFELYTAFAETCDHSQVLVMLEGGNEQLQLSFRRRSSDASCLVFSLVARHKMSPLETTYLKLSFLIHKSLLSVIIDWPRQINATGTHWLTYIVARISSNPGTRKQVELHSCT
jgi:hypothetical protein